MPGRDKSGMCQIVGLFSAVLGAMAISLFPGDKNVSGMANESLGSVFLLLNTFFLALSIVIQKLFIFNDSLQADHPMFIWKQFPLHCTAWAYFWGATFMSFLALVSYFLKLRVFQFGEGSPTDTLFLPKNAMVPLLYALVITSALCYGLLSFANKHAAPSVVTSFWPFQVLVALLLSYSAGFGSITTVQIVSCAFIVIGLACVCKGWSLKYGQFQDDESRTRPLLITTE